jgi:catechol 2,3-dioxygenase-like lactoylglutathione lyase family enzyme
MAAASPEPSELLAVEPQLYVTDLERALGFFTDVLGFGVAFCYGEPPFYGQVVRDGVRLNLRHVDEPLIPAEAMAREPDLISASVLVSNARRLFEEFGRAGAPFHQPLGRAPWQEEGTGAFIVRDPDGNLIHFVGRTD